MNQTNMLNKQVFGSANAINEISSIQMTLTPNPFKNQLSINSTDLLKSQVNIYNILGKRVYSGFSTSNIILCTKGFEFKIFSDEKYY